MRRARRPRRQLLNLTRLGLTVFGGNERAVGIYEHLRFAHEGTMRRFGFGDGAWMDAHMMGRIRPSGLAHLCLSDRPREPLDNTGAAARQLGDAGDVYLDVRADVMTGRSGVNPTDGTLDFFRTVADDVHRYISRLAGGDVQLTEDIVQETFIALFRQRRDAPDIPIGVGWVMTTARNRLIDHVRSRQRERARVERHIAGDVLDSPSPDYDTVSAEQARWLLSCLPEQERLALALHTVDQLSIAEVADLIGRSVEATNSLVARARRRLRNVLKELRDE